MLSVGLWDAALLAATAAHAGFPGTVSALVYPALGKVPAERWRRAHGDHSRRITPVVAVVYVAVVSATTGAVVNGPGAGVLVSAAGTALALAVTALVAAPLHGRLSAGPDPALVRRLLRADRFRSLGALLGLAGAVAAVLG
jgi:hypothetical protein